MKKVTYTISPRTTFDLFRHESVEDERGVSGDTIIVCDAKSFESAHEIARLLARAEVADEVNVLNEDGLPIIERSLP